MTASTQIRLILARRVAAQCAARCAERVGYALNIGNARYNEERGIVRRIVAARDNVVQFKPRLKAKSIN